MGQKIVDKSVGAHREQLLKLAKTIGRIPNIAEVAKYLNCGVTVAHMIVGNRARLTTYLSKWLKLDSDGAIMHEAGPTQLDVVAKLAGESDKLKEDRKLLKVTHQLSEVTQKYKVAMRELNNYEELSKAAIQLRARLPLKIPHAKKKTERTEIIPIFLFSDLHAFERVLPAEVNGKNRYDSKIAAASAHTYFEKALALVNLHRQDTRVDECVVALMGDLMGGMIHLDQQLTNQGSPIDEAMWVRTLLRREIDFLLTNGKFKKITIVTVVGNHARTTLEKMANGLIEYNYESLIYRTLRDDYTAEKRIVWQISGGYFETLDILGKTYRFSHGDWLPGGFSSVSIARSIAAWNKLTNVNYDIFGHTHQLTWHSNWISNGSIIGYNPFSMKIKAGYEKPQQAVVFAGPEGVRQVAAIYVRP